MNTPAYTIYSSSGMKLYESPGFSSSDVRTAALMDDEAVTLSFTHDAPLPLAEGSYAVLGGEAVRWYLLEPYHPEWDNTSGGWRHEPVFHAHWKRLATRYVQLSFGQLGASYSGRQEMDFQYTADLAGHADLLMRNIKAARMRYLDVRPYTAYSLQQHTGDIPTAGELKYLPYQRVTLLDALSALCEAYSCEWWWEGAVLHLGRCYRHAGGTAGQSGGEPMWRLVQHVHFNTATPDRSSEAYANRYHVFGGTGNIPADYRGGASDTSKANVQRRLLLPEGVAGGYIDIEADLDAGAGYSVPSKPFVVDGVLEYDDIVPQHTSVVGTVLELPEGGAIEDESTGKVTRWPVYMVTDRDELGISSADVPVGETLKARFQTGYLAGLTFDVTLHDTYRHTDGETYYRVYEICFNDDAGRYFPDASVKPAVGDEFVLYNMIAATTAREYHDGGHEYTVSAISTNPSDGCLAPLDDELDSLASFTAKAGFGQAAVFTSGEPQGVAFRCSVGAAVAGAAAPYDRPHLFLYTLDAEGRVEYVDTSSLPGGRFKLYWYDSGKPFNAAYFSEMVADAERRLLSRALGDIARIKAYGGIESFTLAMNPVAVRGWRPQTMVLAVSGLFTPGGQPMPLAASDSTLLGTSDIASERWYAVDGAEIGMELGDTADVYAGGLSQASFPTRVTGYTRRLDGSGQDTYTAGIAKPQSRLRSAEDRLSRLERAARAGDPAQGGGRTKTAGYKESNETA